MKILIIAGFSESLIRFRFELIKTLLVSGVEVCVASPDIDTETESILIKHGVRVFEIPLQRTGTNPVKDLKTLTSLRRLMNSIKPDAVLAYTIKPIIYGLLAAHFAKVPKRFALVTGLGYAFTGKAEGVRGYVRKIVQYLYKSALAKTNVIFFQNPDDEALFKQLGITNSYVQTRIVNGSGVNVATYSVVPLPQTPVFLLIARLLGDKGVREYAAAAAIVKQRYPQVCFDLVGWIDENPDAISKEELDSWIAGGVVNFKGKLDDVRSSIEACSVYVLPSYREGTPRTVLEAMAMGRPIITTDAPGCRETVEDGVNGFLVPVKSVQELANKMIELIENPALCVEMGKKSRRIAEEKYDVHKVNDVMLTEMGLK